MSIYRDKIPMILLVLVSISFYSLTAMGESMPMQGQVSFEDFDKNNNGVISEEEFNTTRDAKRKANAEEGRLMRNAAHAPTFAQIDTNSDGTISTAELADMQQKQMNKHMGQSMQQGDGGGFGGGRNKPAFADFDLNGDGAIVENEFEEAREQRVAERSEAGYQMRNMDNAPSFKELDSNSD